MPKVRILKECVGSFGAFKAGAETELGAKDARSLIEAGLAEPVSGKPTPEKKTRKASE